MTVYAHLKKSFAVACMALAFSLPGRANAADDDSFFTLTLLAGQGNFTREKMGQILRQDLAKIGIKVDLQYLEFAAISPRYKLTAKNGATYVDGGYDMYYSGTSLNTFPDPTGIYVRYGSDQNYPDGNNRTRYANPEFDKLIYEALDTPDDALRWGIAKQAIRILREDFACIPIFREPKINLIRTDVSFPENKSYYGWQTYALRWASRAIDGKSSADMTTREKTVIFGTDGSGLEAFLPGFHDNDDTTRALNYMAFDALLTPTVGSYAVGSEDERGPRPALAESWDISDDGKTWTFHMTKDATWHDGMPVTADDVLFTYDLVMNGEAGYGSSKFFKLNGISWSKTDDHTVVFKAEKYNPLFASQVPTLPIVPKHALETVAPADIKTSEYNTTVIIGNGPFTLDEYRPGEFIRWKANDDYYGGRPFYDYVTFKVIPNKTAAFYAMQAGEVDIATSYGFIRELDEMDRTKITPVEQPDISMQIVRINHAHPQLKKQKVREAISLATNRAVLTEVVLNGLARPANQMVPPWSAAYSDDLPALKYDLNAAKKALVEAGFDYSTISVEGPQ